MLTEEQRERRRLGVGASDSAIHMGYSSFKTPYMLYLEKLGMVEPEEPSEVIEWGNRLEGVILDHFGETHGLEVSRPDTIYHPEYEFIFANLDGYVENKKIVVEAKTANAFVKKKWDTAQTDGIPMEYLIQIAKQCHLADAAYGVCAVLIGGCEYLEFTYERDIELEHIIIEEDIKFWDCVQNRIEPPVKTTEDCRLKYKEAEAERTILCDSKIYSYYARLVDLKAQMKELKEIEEKSKVRIMDFMKTNEFMHDEEGQVLVTWKANKRGTRVFNVKGMDV